MVESDGLVELPEEMTELEAGTPVSFEVLTNEIKGLALNMQLHKKATL